MRWSQRWAVAWSPEIPIPRRQLVSSSSHQKLLACGRSNGSSPSFTLHGRVRRIFLQSFQWIFGDSPQVPKRFAKRLCQIEPQGVYLFHLSSVNCHTVRAYCLAKKLDPSLRKVASKYLQPQPVAPYDGKNLLQVSYVFIHALWV